MRVSDSGLGCGPGGSGFHGWPFCNGDVVPGLDLNSVIEYTHRALAGVVGILIVALAVQSWRRYRAQPRARLGHLLRSWCSCSHRPCSAARPWRRTSRRRSWRPTSGWRCCCSAACSGSGEPRARACPGRRPPTAARGFRALAVATTIGGAVHDRGRRLHGRDAEVRAPRLPARRRRAPRLRQGVPQLQRRLHALRPGAARGHPPDTPGVHVRDHAARARARGGGAAAAPESRRGPLGPGDRRACSCSRCSWAP